jgi:CubicO group peptidase (beta-lactamase class C family)
MSVLKESNAIVQRAVDSAIRKGDEVGIQVVAYHGNQIIADVASGIADPKSAKPVDHDTLFNIWSVSKAVTATAVHIQAERGLIEYDAPVARYWPEFAAKGKGAVTVRHVLMHRSGVPQMPDGATPELICDWDWMIKGIAGLEPLAGAGEKPMYQALTFGWLAGELVRRTDPKHRDVNTFIQEEINRPLGIDGLWLGVPENRLDRVATLIDNMAPMSPDMFGPLWERCAPWAVRLTADVFSATSLRRGTIPGVGGIANARSVARLFAMLANGGELDGVRLLSADRVAKFAEPRKGADEPDPVMFNQVMPLSTSGYWLAASPPITFALRTKTAFGHPGVGGSLAWADPAERLAVAFCHNRLFQPQTTDTDPILRIADAVREGLALVQGKGKTKVSA